MIVKDLSGEKLVKQKNLHVCEDILPFENCRCALFGIAIRSYSVVLCIKIRRWVSYRVSCWLTVGTV